MPTSPPLLARSSRSISFDRPRHPIVRRLFFTLLGSEPEQFASLGLASHLDVVSAESKSHWDSGDPFSGVVRDGFVFGRGALDMLHYTATHLSAFMQAAEYAAVGRQLKGTLKFIASADEEMGGELGVGYLANDPTLAPLIDCDVVLCEWGGAQKVIQRERITKRPVTMQSSHAERRTTRENRSARKSNIPLRNVALWLTTGQKGGTVFTLDIAGGNAQQALTSFADSVVRVAAYAQSDSIRPKLPDYWDDFVRGMGYPESIRRKLLQVATLDDGLNALLNYTEKTGVQPFASEARRLHGLTRMTMVPTAITGMGSQNKIADTYTLRVISDGTQDELCQALGSELAARASIAPVDNTYEITLSSEGGHASAPYAIDNPLVDVAYAIRRLNSRPQYHLVGIFGNDNSNVAIDEFSIKFYVRRLPGQSLDDAVTQVQQALGYEVLSRNTLHVGMDTPPSNSPRRTQVTNIIQEVTSELLPSGKILEMETTGGNDGGYWRRDVAETRGRQFPAIFLGTAITSYKLPPSTYVGLLHGTNERVDLLTIHMCCEYFRRLTERFVGENGLTKQDLAEMHANAQIPLPPAGLEH